MDGQRRPAQRADGGPLTFDTRSDAEAWLALRHSERSCVTSGYRQPRRKHPRPAIRTYADGWLTQRDLEDRTREHYAQLLGDHDYPTFGDTLVPAIGPADVRTWYANLNARTGPTARAPTSSGRPRSTPHLSTTPARSTPGRTPPPYDPPRRVRCSSSPLVVADTSPATGPVATAIQTLAEEILFRGVSRVLMRRCGFAAGSLTQAVIFLLPHLLLLAINSGLWPMVVVQGMAGWMQGWLRYRSGSFLPGWLAHAAANLLTPLLIAT